MAKKRRAKKAAQLRSKRGPKNARKSIKARSSSATRRKAAKKAARPAARKAKKAARRAPVRAAKRPVARRVARVAARPAKKAAKSPARASAPKRTPNLDRKRRTVAETEMVPMPPSSLNMDRSASAARTGRAELIEKLHEHTSTGPAMTAGDIDADWESAEAVGDEAPGGDNPTPDQDVVDDIGRALGVEYDDDEELQGGDKIVERDKKRWELDPASSDDFEDR